MDDELQETEKDLYLEPKETDWEQIAKNLAAELIETAKLLEDRQGGEWQSWLSYQAKGLLSQIGLLEGVPDFEIWYHKGTGKYKYDGRLAIPEAIRDGRHAYMYEARDKLLEMRKNGEAMPGLSITWTGLIIITHPWGYPIAIPALPEDE